MSAAVQPQERRVPHWVAGLICLAMVALCLAYHFNRPSLPDWWRASGGGVPYVMFWVSFWFVFFPRTRYVLAIAILCTLFTCGLEVLQLWQPPWLTAFRSTTFGAALLGSGFLWNDIPPYFIGGVLGWLMLHAALRWMPEPNSLPSIPTE